MWYLWLLGVSAVSEGFLKVTMRGKSIPLMKVAQNFYKIRKIQWQEREKKEKLQNLNDPFRVQSVSWKVKCALVI